MLYGYFSLSTEFNLNYYICICAERKLVTLLENSNRYQRLAFILYIIRMKTIYAFSAYLHR